MKRKSPGTPEMGCYFLVFEKNSFILFSFLKKLMLK